MTTTVTTITLRFAFEAPRSRNEYRTVTLPRRDTAAIHDYVAKAARWAASGKKRQAWVSIPGRMAQTSASHILRTWFKGADYAI